MGIVIRFLWCALVAVLGLIPFSAIASTTHTCFVGHINPQQPYNYYAGQSGNFPVASDGICTYQGNKYQGPMLYAPSLSGTGLVVFTYPDTHPPLDLLPMSPEGCALSSYYVFPHPASSSPMCEGAGHCERIHHLTQNGVHVWKYSGELCKEETLCKVVRHLEDDPVWHELECEDGERYPWPGTDGGGDGEGGNCTLTTSNGNLTMTCGDTVSTIPLDTLKGDKGDSCNVEGTETGARIVCENGASVDVNHGEKGDIGPAGADGLEGEAGKSCTVNEDGDGLLVTCEDGRSGRVPYPKGCHVTLESNELNPGVRVSCEDNQTSEFIPFPESCEVQQLVGGAAIVCPQSQIHIDYDELKGEEGEKGEKGDQGEKGDKGDQGEKGDKGDQGEKGEQGAKGDTGATGATGASGPAGADGEDGQNCSVAFVEDGIKITCADSEVQFEPGEEPMGASLGACAAEPTCEDNNDVRCAQLKVQWRQWCRPGDEADGTATCEVKPPCVGTPLQCAKFHSLWAVRCRIGEHVEGAEDCGVPGQPAPSPICTGPALECSQVVDYWRVRCALVAGVTPSEGCETAPACSASPVLCAIREEQWLTRCKLTDAEVAGIGSCGGLPPTCSGSDPIGCAQVQLAWEQRCGNLLVQSPDHLSCEARPVCHLENVETGAINSTCALLIESWESRCTGAEKSLREAEAIVALWDDAPTNPGEFSLGPAIGMDTMLGQLNTTSWAGGGSCPTFESFSVMGVSMSFNAGGAWCNVLSLLRAMVNVAAAFIAMRILVGG